MTNEYNFIDTSPSASPSSATTHAAEAMNGQNTGTGSSSSSSAVSSAMTTTSDPCGQDLATSAHGSNINMEYDQIKYNFLKLLKQFKIFEFDKFMKWLEKLVYDYQRIGYNVIGKLLFC
jgi:hypothetical protein